MHHLFFRPKRTTGLTSLGAGCAGEHQACKSRFADHERHALHIPFPLDRHRLAFLPTAFVIL